MGDDRDLRRAFPRLWDIAALGATTRLSLFVMGVNDLAKEMRAKLTPERTPFLPFLAMAVAAARANGLTVVLDGVCNEFRDLAVFEAEARQGLLFGFDGKSLIHPARSARATRSSRPRRKSWPGPAR